MPSIQKYFTRGKTLAGLQIHRLQTSRPRFSCPVCGYNGVFCDLDAESGTRLHAECPQCHALERHRLQWLVLESLQMDLAFAGKRVLHMAPEPFLEAHLRPRCGSYITADISGEGVDRREDLTGLTFPDSSFDLVYASHVFEHIQDDESAIREVRRVLAPGGLAILPVPMLCEETVEYGGPNPHEHEHVRAPGLDYFRRYEAAFDHVQIFASADFDEKFQTYTYEDRSHWPTVNMPMRRRMLGAKHSDYIPVCRVN
jgi:SAM-dependent methyltransferase